MTTCLSIKNGANQLLRFLLYVSFLLILQNQFLELSRIRCFKPHQLSRDGMIETEFESMQGQASDRIYVFQSIASVADNGMPQILHVYTYLVFSSRFQVQFNERVSIGSFDGTLMRNGLLSPVICRAGVYIQLTVCQPRNHGSCIFFHLADHYGYVSPVCYNAMPVIA